MLKPPLLQRMIVGCWVLITINTLIFGFVIFLPQFFLRQGLTIANSLAYTLVLSIGSLVGCAVGAYLSDAIGRRWSIIGASVVTIISGYIYARFNAASDPAIVLSVGFVLIVAIYVQTAILFGVYTPELFPTEIRLARQRHLQHARTRRHRGLALHRRRADGFLPVCRAWSG